MADLFGNQPASYKHPLTGVELNALPCQRKSLAFEDAVTAWILRLQGVTFTKTVSLLGTNANRVGEVFRGEVWPKAYDAAVSMLTKGGN